MSKSITMTKYILGASAAITVGTGMYMLCNNKNRFEILTESSIKEAEDLTIKNFINFINQQPDITVDQAILKFENTEETSLDKYAEIKHRTKENYYNSYKALFIKAKKNLKKQQANLEKLYSK